MFDISQVFNIERFLDEEYGVRRGPTIKCAHCSAYVLIEERVEYKGLCYHYKCFENVYFRQLTDKYLCQLFGWKKPSPKSYQQRENFITKYGYDERGMLLALLYHFEVNKGEIKDAKEGVGIIPFVYEAAQVYYDKFKTKQDYVAQQINDGLEEQEKQRYTLKVKELDPSSRQKSMIDLEKI